MLEVGVLLHSTLVIRSKVSFSCKCFPVLLARSIHFPLNHLMVGLRRRSLASTLATKVMSPPLGTKQYNMTTDCPTVQKVSKKCNFKLLLNSSLLCHHLPTGTLPLWGFSISRMDSGGLSMGLSSSSGAWPSPRDHTGQFRETHTSHTDLHGHCARIIQGIHTPTFHFSSECFSLTREELQRQTQRLKDKQFDTFSHFQQSHLLQQQNLSSLQHGKHETDDMKHRKGV